MAVPKKKTSKSRRNMRRYASGNAMEKVQLMTCPNCNETTRPHRICDCGFYAGKKVLAKRQKSTEATA
jgi:large subunit ribosomal protein L32